MTGNQAVNVNRVVGERGDLAITVHASSWYFAVCAVMGAATLVFMGLAMAKPASHRLFHYITASITAVACIAYWSMGADLGQVPVQAEFVRAGSITGRAGSREVFWARYVDWFVTTPLLLLDLLLTAGAPWPTIAVTLVADEIMIVTGLVGALTETSYKWGYWTFGTVALFFIAYELAVNGRKHANALGGPVQSTFLHCGLLTLFLWFLYPIAWGVSEGGNVIHPDSEAIFYGILDILAKPGFGFLLLWGHNKIDPAQLGLVFPDGPAGAPGEKAQHQTTTPDAAPPAGTNNNGTTAV